MSEARRWRRLRGTQQRAKLGSSTNLAGRMRIPRASVGILSSPRLLNVNRVLVAEIIRSMESELTNPHAIAVVTDDASVMVWANPRAEQIIGATSSEIVGRNICEVIGLQESGFRPRFGNTFQRTTAAKSLSCLAVTPIDLQGKKWLLWELGVDGADKELPQNKIVSTEIDGLQLRFDSAETFTTRDSGVTSSMTKVDRHQAVLTLEAETYRGAVQRLTSLMGQLDLLVLSTTRLERRLSAASELQPLLSRAISESKQIAESLGEMHSLHRSYLPKLQWCNLKTILNRCCAALKRESSDSNVTLIVSDEAASYMIHVDPAAFGLAFFWLVRTAMVNLSAADRVIHLRSDYIDHEMRLRAVYRRRETIGNATKPTAGVLQIEDQVGIQGPTRSVPFQAPLDARWAIENRLDGSALFDLFIRCPRTEL